MSTRRPSRAAAAETAAGAEVLGLPPPVDVVLLAVAVVGVSTSGPLMAAAAAPALAIAFWRTAMASGALVPIAAMRSRRELRGLGRRQWLACGLAGVLLAGHFGTWVPGVRLSSVASATALVCTQPVWTALIVRLGGVRIARAVWLGIALAVVGATLITGIDVTVSTRALVGDLLALVGGAFAGLYVTVGEATRRTVSTTAYATICYTVCAVVLLAGCLLGGQRLGGYSGRTWLQLAAVTVAAQLAGHTLVNRVLRTTSATMVSLVLLIEVPGAALLAAAFLGQSPSPLAVPGFALLLGGLAVVVRQGIRLKPNP